MKHKTNKQKLIELYEECSKTGKLPMPGLCNCITNYLEMSQENLLLFQPNSKDMYNIDMQKESSVFWASGIKRSLSNSHVYKFTPLRQTILAFLIAMED